jgi:hypothetical protein
MLLDSGADVTLVPSWAARLVEVGGAEPDVLLAAYDGAVARYPVARLRIEFQGRRFTGAFVLVESAHGTMGRNILNQVIVTLDGPNQTWSMTAI